jgi:hypothetical protein
LLRANSLACFDASLCVLLVLRFDYINASAIRRVLLFLLFLPGIKANADATLFIGAPINFLGHVSSTGHVAPLVDDLFVLG